MRSSYAEMWMEKKPLMNSYSVVAQTMTFWLSCFPWVCTPGMCSSVCWSTRCVWGSEASARGWLVGFVSMNWPSAYASQSMRQLGQQCSRSHIHRPSKCLLMCVCVRFVFKQLSVSFKRQWTWRLGSSRLPLHVVLVRETQLCWFACFFVEDCQLFYLHLFPGQSKLCPWLRADSLARDMGKITSHFTGNDLSIQTTL